MRPEDPVLVNAAGEVVGGNMHSINPAGYVIHSAGHEVRPDVAAAVHCHSRAA
jgi:ribulose-5-phosphate 4-epimerase/fuculose-1-phosphate aldolase